jgi:hypothetical protein
MTNLKSQGLLSCARSVQGRIVFSGMLLLASASLLSLSGCSLGMTSGSDAGNPTAGVDLHGSAFGGQQPVNGGTVQLYSAPATGYAHAATALLTSTVTTQPDGTFNITASEYTCPGSPNDQVYLTVTGGNAGSGVNNNLALVAALGTCANLPNDFVNINELTTVASAYALSGFATDATHIGTSSTNYTGLKNAFATVNNLVNVGTGAALSVTPAYAGGPTGGTSPVTFASVVPQAEINTLGNLLSSCVNSGGGTAGDGSACGNLFTATTVGTAVPTDTFQAALSMAHHPGNNVGTLYGYSAVPSAPFSPVLATTPNDWTIALNFIGGGLGGNAGTNDAAASDLAIDVSGNIWTANNRTGVNSISELSNLGAPVSPSTILTPTVIKGGFHGGGLSNPDAIAIDPTSSNVWVSNSNAAQISEFTEAGIAVSGSGGFTGGGLTSTNKQLAIDGNGSVWVASNSTIAKFDSSGNPLSGAGFTSNINGAYAIAVDGATSGNSGGDIWVANSGNGFAVKLSNSGTPLLTSSNDITASFTQSAIDRSGSFWVPQPGTTQNLISWTANMSIPSGTSVLVPAGSNPAGIAVDGGNNIWVANQGNGGNVIELNGGSIVSPAGGYTGNGNPVANLFAVPKALGVDGSGNIWIINGTNVSTLTEFVGTAVPTITPKALAVQNNTIGQRP